MNCVRHQFSYKLLNITICYTLSHTHLYLQLYLYRKNLFLHPDKMYTAVSVGLIHIQNPIRLMCKHRSNTDGKVIISTHKDLLELGSLWTDCNDKSLYAAL